MDADEPKPQDWREGRRKRAFELRELGWRDAQIAEALGVTRGAVSQWFTRRAEQGQPAWQSKPHPGRPAKLTEQQLLMIPDMLSHGAEAWGFRGEIWTAQRVTMILRWQYGVQYDASGFYLVPGLVRSYAPRGDRPELHPFLTRDHLSVISAVTPGGQLYSHTSEQAT